jgi:hypothetical protein
MEARFAVIIAVVAFGVGHCFGWCSGVEYGEDKVEKLAVKHGFGEWHFDDDGDTAFRWKD